MLRLALLPIATVLALAAPADAQTYPDRPVKIMAPSAPGGGFDFVGRVLADKLPEQLGQPFVVENRAGAGTMLGTQVAASAPPNGYTLLVGGLSNIALNPGLYKQLTYNPSDFVPVALVISYSYTWIARPNLPQSSLKEVIDFARANPGKLNLAISGLGTGQHVGAAILCKLTGVTMENITYKGAQPVYTDLLSDRVDVFFDNTTTARPYIESGRVKALAISSAARNPLLPDLPTITETGAAPFVMETWFGLFAPAKAPAPVIEKLRGAVAEIMKSPAVRAAFEKSGGTLLDMKPTETEAFVKAEITKWTKLVRDAGVTAE